MRRVGARLVVVKGGVTLTAVRLRELERVVLFGNVELSGPAMGILLESGIETVLLSYNGKFRGRLVPMESKNVFLRQKQFERYGDPAFRVGIAQTILAAKVRNGRALLQRHHWDHAVPELPEAIELMGQGRERLFEQGSVESLLGI